VGIKVRERELRRTLERARDWALDAQRPVSAAWTTTTTTLLECPTKTIVPAFGAALLAKATYPKIDALAIKEGYSENAFSLRGVAHNVLVPASRDDRYPFDLLVRGREPLNNQPFFRYDHWEAIERIDVRARRYYDEAIYRLEALNRLPPPKAAEEALAGLAAFLRDRIDAAARQLPDLSGVTLAMGQAIRTCKQFLTNGRDRPLRAQSVGAGVYDAVYGREHVESRGVYDPSREGPGDIRVVNGSETLIACEVRSKPVTEPDAYGFIDACAHAGIGRVHILALAQRTPFDRRALDIRGQRRGAFVLTMESVEELFSSLVGVAPLPLQMVLDDIPVRVGERLYGSDASQETMDEWAASCS
jgi:hypothetical protein